jgi:hypothetical protein
LDFARMMALPVADERMYANKASRSPTSRQVTDALLQVITEQNAHLDDHVAELLLVLRRRSVPSRSDRR